MLHYRIITITDVTVGATSDLKLFLDGVCIKGLKIILLKLLRHIQGAKDLSITWRWTVYKESFLYIMQIWVHKQIIIHKNVKVIKQHKAIPRPPNLFSRLWISFVLTPFVALLKSSKVSPDKPYRLQLHLSHPNASCNLWLIWYWRLKNTVIVSYAMGLLPDTWNCGLCMRQECRERFPRHLFQGKPPFNDPDMHHDTCVTHTPWCMSGSLTSGSGENVPSIPGACATHNFTYLASGPWDLSSTATEIIS